MTQIAFAIHAYESTFGRFPAGVINSVGPIRSVPVGYHHNWISAILPQMDHPNLYRAIDFQSSVYHANNLVARREHPRGFMCPSSPSSTSGGGTSPYCGIHHSREAPIDSSNDGFFVLNTSFRVDDIPDGLSSTAMLSEKLTLGTDLGWLSGTRATLRNAGTNSLLNRTLAGGLVVIDGYSREFRENELTMDSTELELKAYQEKGFLDEAPEWISKPLEVGSFGSFHALNGVHFGHADGSIRFVSHNVDFMILQQLSSRLDGLPLTIPE